jgi:hypothetical protein
MISISFPNLVEFFFKGLQAKFSSIDMQYHHPRASTNCKKLPRRFYPDKIHNQVEVEILHKNLSDSGRNRLTHPQAQPTQELNTLLLIMPLPKHQTKPVSYSLSTKLLEIRRRMCSRVHKSLILLFR